MSSFEIIGAIGAIINLLELTGATYKVIQNYKDLPNAFKEVGERLPLTRNTLSAVEAQAKNVQIDTETIEAIQPLLQGCQGKVNELQHIFDKVRRWEGKSVRAKYHRFLDSVTGKGKQVELLMMAVLKDVQSLAANRTFETATAAQMEELNKAIEDLLALEPDELGGGGGRQVVHGSVKGDVNYTEKGPIMSSHGGPIYNGHNYIGTNNHPKKPEPSDDSSSD